MPNQKNKMMSEDLDLNDPIAKLLAEPKNAELACEIYNAFPGAVVRLAKLNFLRNLEKSCKKKLQGTRGWIVQLEPNQLRQLLREPWPGVGILPQRHEPYWSFWFEMEADDFPLTFEHGVCFPEEGGKPGSMSSKLRAEVRKAESNFSDEKFRVRQPTNNWFSSTDKPYTRLSLGDRPDVVKKLVSGALVDEVCDEFMNFFEKWSPVVEGLNALLTR